VLFSLTQLRPNPNKKTNQKNSLEKASHNPSPGNQQHSHRLQRDSLDRRRRGDPARNRKKPLGLAPQEQTDPRDRDFLGGPTRGRQSKKRTPRKRMPILTNNKQTTP